MWQYFSPLEDLKEEEKLVAAKFFRNHSKHLRKFHVKINRFELFVSCVEKCGFVQSLSKVEQSLSNGKRIELKRLYG